MTDTHILMAMITGLGAILFGLMLVFWTHFNKRFDEVDTKFDKVDTKFDKVDARFDKVDARFDKMDEKITDIDRRLCRLEGAFSSKECCILHHHGEQRKVE